MYHGVYWIQHLVLMEITLLIQAGLKHVMIIIIALLLTKNSVLILYINDFFCFKLYLFY